MPRCLAMVVPLFGFTNHQQVSLLQLVGSHNPRCLRLRGVRPHRLRRRKPSCSPLVLLRVRVPGPSRSVSHNLASKHRWDRPHLPGSALWIRFHCDLNHPGEGREARRLPPIKYFSPTENTFTAFFLRRRVLKRRRVIGTRYRSERAEKGRRPHHSMTSGPASDNGDVNCSFGHEQITGRNGNR